MVPRCGSLSISLGSPLFRGLQPWLSRSTPPPPTMEMEDAGFLQASRCHLLLEELIHTDKFVSVSLGEKWSSCSLRWSRFGGPSSPRVAPAPCPSMQLTIKWLMTRGSTCVFSQRFLSRPEGRCSQGCPVSQRHSPSLVFKGQKLVLQSKLILPRGFFRISMEQLNKLLADL